MPRSYGELLSSDPAWPTLLEAIEASANGAVVLPPHDTQRESCLLGLDVTTRSTLGAVAHETGGLLVDHGYVRLFGSGSDALPRQLGAWNAELGIAVSRYLIVADDVVGGVFAMNGAELGGVAGNVHYFAPDALAWKDLALEYADFVSWVLEGDLETFYEAMRWPGWEEEIAALRGEQVLSIVPPLWADPHLPIAKRDRRAVPAKELWNLQQQFTKTFAGR